MKIKRIILLYLCFLSFLFAKSQNISGIINNYQAVIDFDFCKNSVLVQDASGFSVGQKVLLIQMKGAIIDTTNTPTSGSVIDYGNAGNYEFAFISSINNNEIILRDSIIYDYDDDGFMQIVSVPQYTNVTVNDTLKCLSWDGTKGGILVFEVSGTLTLNAPIDVSNRGFRGGQKIPTCSSDCYNFDPHYVKGNLGVHSKGEGIATLPVFMFGGRGTIANGAGAGGGQAVSAGHNDAFFMGGGGGGNFGNGGRGGKSTTSCPIRYEGGLGGRALIYSNADKKIFMGGGGGSGHHRYITTGPEFGTNGGGLVIIKAQTIVTNNNSILAYAIDVPNIYNNVGRSGGGAGGTVALEVQNYIGNLSINVQGGKGGDNSGSQRVGPGGGGAGGMIWVSQTNFPANITTILNGGLNGMQTSHTDPWGATAGEPGGTLTGLSLTQTSNKLFVPFNLSTSITTNSPLCIGDTLVLTAGALPSGALVVWNGPNGFTANTPIVSINDIDTTEAGQYSLEISVQGCLGPKTFANVFVGIYPDAPITTADTVCFGNPNPNITAIGNNLSWYADAALTNLLSNDSVFSPPAQTVGTHYYYVTQRDSVCEGPAAIASLVILPTPQPPHVANQIVCFGDTVLPFVATGNGIISWYADMALNNLIIVSDTLISTETSVGIYNYYVTLFDTVYNCLSQPQTVGLTINPLPYAIATNDTSICFGDSIYLSVAYNTNFPSSFIWSNNATQDAITVSPVSNTMFFVTVQNICGIAIDSVSVTVNPIPIANAESDTSICFGQQAHLHATGGGDYVWSANLGTNPSITVSPTVNTTYTVTVTNTYGCTDKDDVTVLVLELPEILISGDTFICEGNMALLTASGGQLYVWNDGTTQNTLNVTPLSTTSYTLTVTHLNGCSASTTVQVEVHPIFSIELTSNFAPEHAITKGQNMIFTATPNNYQGYDFSINKVLVQSGSSNTYSSAAMSHNDWVKVTAKQFNCPSVPDSIQVKVKELPNAFTPFDKDGVNEIFAKGLELTILNKWGQEIYKGTEGWNGEFKNQRVSPGSYFYIIELNKDTEQAEILTGSITVVSKK